MSSAKSTPKEAATKSEVQEMKTMFEMMMTKMAELSIEVKTMKHNPIGSTSSHHAMSVINLNFLPVQTPIIPGMKEQSPIQQLPGPKYDSEEEGSWYGGSSDDNEDEIPKEKDVEMILEKTLHSKAHSKSGKSAREEEYDRKMAELTITQEEMQNQLKQMANGKSPKIGHNWEK